MLPSLPSARLCHLLHVGVESSLLFEIVKLVTQLGLLELPLLCEMRLFALEGPFFIDLLVLLHRLVVYLLLFLALDQALLFTKQVLHLLLCLRVANLPCIANLSLQCLEPFILQVLDKRIAFCK